MGQMQPTNGSLESAKSAAKSTGYASDDHKESGIKQSLVQNVQNTKLGGEKTFKKRPR